MAKLIFDENNLTIGDLEDFEDATGVELQNALKPVPLRDDEGNLVRNDKGEVERGVEIKPKMLKALVWIANRHDDESFTLDDARRVKVTELEIIRQDDDADTAPEADPKD